MTPDGTRFKAWESAPKPTWLLAPRQASRPKFACAWPLREAKAAGSVQCAVCSVRRARLRSGRAGQGNSQLLD